MPADRTVEIEAFGDPACPWDFSAEGCRLRLRWRYGDQLRWRHRMVVLSRTVDEYTARGLTPQDLAQGRRTIAELLGMPIDTSVAPRHIATVVACRAVSGVFRAAPARGDAFLRALRVRGMSSRQLIDEARTIHDAARDAGISPRDCDHWWAHPDTVTRLERDMELARAPLPAALAQPDRLAPTAEGGTRYTCPSYVVRRDDTTLVAPGYQPARTYEALVANVAPDLVARPLPDNPRELLAWAPYDLCTAEVATIMDLDMAAARARLEDAGARFTPIANDGYWSL